MLWYSQACDTPSSSKNTDQPPGAWPGSFQLCVWFVLPDFQAMFGVRNDLVKQSSRVLSPDWGEGMQAVTATQRDWLCLESAGRLSPEDWSLLEPLGVTARAHSLALWGSASSPEHTLSKHAGAPRCVLHRHLVNAC